MEKGDNCRDLFKVTFIVGTFYIFNCLINELSDCQKIHKTKQKGREWKNLGIKSVNYHE